MAEPAWFELHVVVRTTADLLAKLRDAVDESDLAEIERWDLTPLDADRRRWDGSPATSLPDAPAPLVSELHVTHPDQLIRLGFDDL